MTTARDSEEWAQLRAPTARRVPDFFIVGAPKCGTTALDQYLRAHPQIFMPNRKEAHFFGADLQSPHNLKTPEEYYGLFKSAPRDCCVGEASVGYLYSETAAAEIASANPDARVIAMLRDPLEMLPSLHSQALITGDENIRNFQEALDAEAERRHGRCLTPPAARGFVQILYYSQIARYSKQLERYLQSFPADQVHIILYDDFRADIAGVYKGVLRFLGVDQDFQPNFPVVNANRTIRRPWLWRVTKFSPSLLRKAWRGLLPKATRGRLLHRAARMYSARARREPLDASVAERIREMYQDDVSALSTLIGRDLSHWLGGIR